MRRSLFNGRGALPTEGMMVNQNIALEFSITKMAMPESNRSKRRRPVFLSSDKFLPRKQPNGGKPSTAVSKRQGQAALLNVVRAVGSRGWREAAGRPGNDDGR